MLISLLLFFSSLFLAGCVRGGWVTYGHAGFLEPGVHAGEEALIVFGGFPVNGHFGWGGGGGFVS